MRLLGVLLMLAVATVSAQSPPFSDFVKSTTHFSFDFFKEVYAPDENLVTSPISVQTALSMFYPLAGSSASAEMEKVLHLPADKNKAVAYLQQFLTDPSFSKNSAALKMFSKLYHVDKQLNPNLLSLFREQFNAETAMVNFQNAAAVVQAVNLWTEKATGGLIKNFLQESDLSEGIELLLLNVIALNATWRTPFDEDCTKIAQFDFLNGVQEVNMMHMQDSFPVAVLHQYKCQALEIAYLDETDLSMILVLPNRQETLENVVRGLDSEFYTQLDSKLQERPTFLGLPRFVINKKLDVKEYLMKMGLKSIFQKAELDVLSDHKSVMADVRQTAFIKVNEHGTEAAAATEVEIIPRMSTPMFYVDRPFMYIIRKRSTKDILFMGHLSVHEQS